MLQPLRGFFRTLYEHGATLRLLSDSQDFELTREAIDLAIDRTETLQFSDPYFEEIVGRIFTMPDSKRFELLPIGGARPIKGRIATEFVREMFDKDFAASVDFNGKVMKSRLGVRETRLHDKVVRKSYQLMAVNAPPVSP